MPVRKVGPNSYQWGNSGKVYSGKGAKAKAERQGRAIYSSGYRGSAESYKPPASAVSNAKRGLRLRKEWGRGGLSPSEAKSQGIDSGVTRARKISSGKVSRHDVRRMSAFNRHRKNYRPEKKMSDGGPTAGTIAWLLWGGTSGVNWAKKKSAAMNAEDYAAESFEAETWGVQIYDTDLTMADVKKMLKDAGIKTKGSVRKIGNGYAYYFKFDSSHQSKFEKAFNKFGKAGNYEYEAEMPALTGKEELKTYEVSVPVLHYYGIGPVEAYDEDEAADEVRNNWSYWRTTIEDNGDWGGPLWRYSPITSHEPEASEIFASETFGDVDPDGPLAKALARAREELKKPKKPLQITRLPHPNQKTLMDYDAEDGSDSGCYDPNHFDCNSCFEICLDCHPSKIGGQDSIGENLCMDCVAHKMAVKEPCKCGDNRKCIECVNCLGCEVQLYESGDYGMICTGCASLYVSESYEADWRDLPRNKLGQWQRPISAELLQNVIATTSGVPKLSELLNLYGGDSPNNRYRLYNDMITLRIETEDFDDDTVVIDVDNDPEIYYQHILEEPLDIEEEDERLTPEFWDRYSRYLAMTNTLDEIEARIESLVSNLDLFNDDEFSEIGVMMAALRQQKFMEKYQAE